MTFLEAMFNFPNPSTHFHNIIRGPRALKTFFFTIFFLSLTGSHASLFLETQNTIASRTSLALFWLEHVFCNPFVPKTLFDVPKMICEGKKWVSSLIFLR